MRARFPLLLWMIVTILTGVAALSACDGCRRSGSTTTTPATDASLTPSIRFFFVSDLAGALEPCGCVKDQLGGMDHFGALVAAEKKTAKKTAVFAVGPTHFMDAEVAPEKKNQETRKAVAIADCLAAVGLEGWVPGKNDEANGKAVWDNLAPNKILGTTTVSADGLTIAVIGVQPPPAKVDVRAQVDEAKKKGATAFIVLAAVGRGEAKRIADAVPELLAVVVASPVANGEESVHSAPAERVGETLIIQPANHLQTVAVLDVFARGGDKIADGTGIDRIKKREELSTRINELREKVATWEKDKAIDPKDVEARKADMAKLEAERDALDKQPPPVTTGSFYRYAMDEVRQKLGEDDKVKARMLAYYKQVNDENKEAFKDKKPAAPAKGEAKYIGVELCANCHEDAKKVWDGTAHAHAYATLSKQFKEFNLDCVSCHVTGYDKPGGSTVTFVSELKDVQCEVCHGPGELHAKKPESVKMPIPKPSAQACTTCHQPPHVHSFDAKAKMADILGPGHGQKK